MLLNGEDLLTLPAAAREIKRNGRSVASSTVYRWAHKGHKGIKLETIMCGGTTCTSLAAVNRFFERLTAARDGAPDPMPEYTARQASVNRDLDRLLGARKAAEVEARLDRHFNRSGRAK